LKPAVGTLSSLTWFCRGIYANVNNNALVDKGVEACTVNTLGLNSSSSTTSNRTEEQKHSNDNIEQAAIAASKVSDISPEVCQQILCEFDKMNKQRADHHLHRHKSQ